MQGLSLNTALLLTAISTFFAAVSGVAALISVIQARKERLESQKPSVLGYYDFTEAGAFVFVLANEGNGPAIDVEDDL